MENMEVKEVVEVAEAAEEAAKKVPAYKTAGKTLLTVGIGLAAGMAFGKFVLVPIVNKVRRKMNAKNVKRMAKKASKETLEPDLEDMQLDDIPDIESEE